MNAQITGRRRLQSGPPSTSTVSGLAADASSATRWARHLFALDRLRIEAVAGGIRHPAKSAVDCGRPLIYHGWR